MKKTLTKPLTKSKPLTRSSKSLGKKPLKKKEVEFVVVEQPKPKVKLTKPKPPPPPKPTSGPMPTVPKGYKFMGRKDPRNKGWLLVEPVNMPPGFPPANPKCVPDTFWRVNPKTGDIDSLVTLMPDKVYVAWSECIVCSNSVKRCICKFGWMHPRGIEWIYIRALMSVDGLRTKQTEPIIDSTHYDVTSRALHWYKGKETGHVPAPRAAPVRTRTADVTAPKPLGGAKPLRKAGKPADRPPRPLTKALRKSEPVEPVLIDIAANDAAAETGADAAVLDLTKRLSKKPLKKR